MMRMSIGCCWLLAALAGCARSQPAAVPVASAAPAASAAPIVARPQPSAGAAGKPPAPSGSAASPKVTPPASATIKRRTCPRPGRWTPPPSNDLQSAERRVELAKICRAEAQGAFDDYSAAMDSQVVDITSGKTKADQDKVLESVAQLNEARERLSAAEQEREDAEQQRDSLQTKLAHARLWRFGLGVTGAAAAAAGSREYQGLGGMLVYRASPQLEFDFVLRADDVRELESKARTFPTVRLLTSFGGKGIALTVGAGAALTDAHVLGTDGSQGSLPKILHFGLRFRPAPLGDYLGCGELTPFADVSLFAEPWLVMRGPASDSPGVPLFVGLAATIGLGGGRSGDRYDLRFADGTHPCGSPAKTANTAR